MKQRFYCLLTILICVTMILSACGDTSLEQPEEPLEPDPSYPSTGQDSESGGNTTIHLPSIGGAYPPPLSDTIESIENPYPEPLAPADSRIVAAPLESEFAPATGDEKLKRGNVFIDATEVLLLESYPVQVNLQLTGNLPTPCHQLRVIVSEPDDQNRIQVEAYSVTDPNVICIQVLEPLDVRVSLGDFTEGEFSIWVNGEQVGEFSLP
ncbi:MAG: hypothetical protein KJ638_01415 [Chloroflexi bacterium]|nr:hypothetical protein [Chloroflexota bacterium]